MGVVGGAHNKCLSAIKAVFLEDFCAQTVRAGSGDLIVQGQDGLWFVHLGIVSAVRPIDEH